MRMRPGVIVTFGVLLTASACSQSGTGPVASPSAPAPASTSPAPSGTPSGSSGGGVAADDRRRRRDRQHVDLDPDLRSRWAATIPTPTEACAAVEGHRKALNPVPKDRMCAQVYGGPEKATITGTWRGEPIFAVLARTNACETARWDALVPLVPPGGGSRPTARRGQRSAAARRR